MEGGAGLPQVPVWPGAVAQTAPRSQGPAAGGCQERRGPQAVCSRTRPVARSGRALLPLERSLCEGPGGDTLQSPLLSRAGHSGWPQWSERPSPVLPGWAWCLFQTQHERMKRKSF